MLDQKYNSLLSVIIGLPEFRCSRGGVESECFDEVKLQAFERTRENNKEYYRNLFGTVKNIWIDLPGNDLIIYGSTTSSGAVYSVPVSLYNPVTREYRIGILKIKGDL